MNYFYINTQTLEYPLYEGDIRLVYENIGDVFELPSDGVFARVDIDLFPEIDYATQEHVFGTPIFTSGKWTQPVSIKNLTEQEIVEKRELNARIRKKLSS